jgi:hypothetical protein
MDAVIKTMEQKFQAGLSADGLPSGLLALPPPGGSVVVTRSTIAEFA